MPETQTVRTGADRLAAEPGLVEDAALGLFTNYTGVLSDLRRTIDALLSSGVKLSALFTPEHGLWGTVQAGESEPGGVDSSSGLPVFDTYRRHGAALDAQLRDSQVAAVLVDLQDIGVRFYTYIWSVFDLLCSAARTDVRVVVLDRPNPLGGAAVEGPGLVPGCSSFVGRVSIPIRHGLTMGELARWFNAVHVPAETGRSADLDVVTVSGWERSMIGPAAGQPWVFPSPNIPTFDSVLAYPGTCLIEGTTLSEGRGTTRPFEIVGATYADDRLAAALAERDLKGVAFRDLKFVPTFHKGAGELHRGVQLHVSDPVAFEPVRTGVTLLAVLAELYPDDFAWQQRSAWQQRESEGGPPSFVDLLWGSTALRKGIDAGLSVDEILTTSPPTPVPPAEALLYP